MSYADMSFFLLSGIGRILHVDRQFLLLQSVQSCSGWSGASVHPIPVSPFKTVTSLFLAATSLTKTLVLQGSYSAGPDLCPPREPRLHWREGQLLQTLAAVQHSGQHAALPASVRASVKHMKVHSAFVFTTFCINQTSNSSRLRHYELKRNEDIVSFFNDFSDHLAEEALWELSLKIKPRNITRRKTDREEKT